MKKCAFFLVALMAASCQDQLPKQWFMKGRASQAAADQKIDELAGVQTIVGTGPAVGCDQARSMVAAEYGKPNVRLRWYEDSSVKGCQFTYTDQLKKEVVVLAFDLE